MTSLVITLKKLNHFAEVVQIKVSGSEKNNKVVEGYLSAEDQELVAFLFLFSLC